MDTGCLVDMILQLEEDVEQLNKEAGLVARHLVRHLFNLPSAFASAQLPPWSFFMKYPLLFSIYLSSFSDVTTYSLNPFTWFAFLFSFPYSSSLVTTLYLISSCQYNSLSYVTLVCSPHPFSTASHYTYMLNILFNSLIWGLNCFILSPCPPSRLFITRPYSFYTSATSLNNFMSS